MNINTYNATVTYYDMREQSHYVSNLGGSLSINEVSGNNSLQVQARAMADGAK